MNDKWFRNVDISSHVKTMITLQNHVDYKSNRNSVFPYKTYLQLLQSMLISLSIFSCIN